MAIAVFPLIVLVIGLLLWGLTKGIPAEAGKWAYVVGLAALCFSLAKHVITVG